MKSEPNIEVFFDGDCPVCRWEITVYERLDKDRRIRWTNILELSATDLPEGKTVADLLGRFHVRDLPIKSAQEWHVAVDAFARIWRELPVFKWFAWIFSIPGVRQLAQFAYLGFVRWQTNQRQKRAHVR